MIERDPSTLIGRDLSVQTPLSSFLAATGNSELVLVFTQPIFPPYYTNLSALVLSLALKLHRCHELFGKGGPLFFFVRS